MKQVFPICLNPSPPPLIPIKGQQPASRKSSIGPERVPFKGDGACAMGFQNAENTCFILLWYLMGLIQYWQLF